MVDAQLNTGNSALSLQIRQTLHGIHQKKHCQRIAEFLDSPLLRASESALKCWVLFVPMSKRMWKRCRESSTELHRWHGTLYMTSEERLEELNWQKGQCHDLIAVYRSLRDNCKYAEAKLFLIVPDGAMRGCGHNLQLEMFRPSLRGNVFTWTLVQKRGFCPGGLWKLPSCKFSRLCCAETWLTWSRAGDGSASRRWLD